MPTARSLTLQIADWTLTVLWAFTIGSIPGTVIGLIPWELSIPLWIVTFCGLALNIPHMRDDLAARPPTPRPYRRR